MTAPEEILSDGGETYARKNEDYGDSWRKVGRILHMLADGDTVELNSVEDHISYGLFTRRLDKLARAYHGEFVADEMNFESIVDSHEDEMTYAAMHSSNQQARAHPPSADSPQVRAQEIAEQSEIRVEDDGRQ